MLAQLSTSKSRLPIAASDTADDALITNLLNFFTGRAEEECNRKFDRAVDATYEFRADDMNVYLDRYPIESVKQWHVKANETDGWEEQTGVDFLIAPRKNILELASPLGVSTEIARVTFTGGYVLPGGTVGTGQTALPAAIENACVEQVAYWYQNRNRLGLQSLSGEGGSISQMPMSIVKPLDLLPQVAKVLRDYERWHP